MDLPQLPTDNLYKFVAIAGLTLFVVSVVFPMRETWKVEQRLARIQAQYEVDQLETDLRLPGYLRFRDISTTLLAGQDTLNDSVKTALTQERDSIASQWSPDTTNRVMRELGETLNEMRVNTTEIGVLNKQNRRLVKLARWGAGIGAMLTVFGFGLWYFRVQRYQDAALKRRAEADIEQSTPQKPE